jgi:hypothetical protein
MMTWKFKGGYCALTITALLCTGTASYHWHTATCTALDDLPSSFQAANVSSPSATADEDEDIPFGHLRQSVPAEPAYEPTWAPASSVRTPLHQEDGLLLDEPPLKDPEVAASALELPWMEEDAAVFLTWEQTCSASYWDDGDTHVLHPITAPAAEMMANMEGTTCHAYSFPVFPLVVAGPMSGVMNIVYGRWHDVQNTVSGIQEEGGHVVGPAGIYLLLAYLCFICKGGFLCLQPPSVL